MPVNLSYNNTVPAANNNPSVDQPQMLVNTTSISSIVNQDHIGFGQNNGGTHRQVNMYNQATPPLINDLNLYSNISVGANSLWVQTPTLNLPLFAGQPTGGVTGATSVIGNIQFRWGLKTVATNADTAVVFPIAFAGGQCWNVLLTAIRNNSGSDTVFIKTGSVSGAGFTIKNNSGSITQVYWFAIGQ